MSNFKLHSSFKPTGDQPAAIEKLAKGIEEGKRFQTLLGATGTGKTFTMANVIAKVKKPTLVLAHNKILAAQLCSEFREFFPDSAVEYFVSYYDYYQPESYLPATDVYIEKDSSINDEIEKLRHSATSALFERRDVIIVSSVSCIYSLGDPAEYEEMTLSVRVGMQLERDELIRRLISIQYERNDFDFSRNKFRVKGDTVEVFPSYSAETAIRIEFFGDEVERITEIICLTGEVTGFVSHVAIYPASHYVIGRDKLTRALTEIERETEERIKYFENAGKFVEAQRIKQRSYYDMELLRETGFCKGIENYSGILSGRPRGSAPYTLLDYFPDDFIVFIDESHVTVPQVRGMYAGDRARKETLVNYGFRLPSALDNRPLNFNEFNEKVHQTVFVSATPSQYEREVSGEDNIVEQILRPTGLLEPEISVRPISGQVEDLYGEIKTRSEKNERVLVTTLTKKMAEDLTDYLVGMGIKAKYLHHDIDTIERMKIIKELRSGEFDCLVGINLLREGLDLPEVSLVAILDADKPGFLRSDTSLIQTIGRAARNANGQVIMYGDSVTPAMEIAIKESNRRREIQKKYNEEHGIVPHSIVKDIREVIEISSKEEVSKEASLKISSEKEKLVLISELEKQMKEAARMLEFEHAAFLRDKIMLLKNETPKSKKRK